MKMRGDFVERRVQIGSGRDSQILTLRGRGQNAGEYDEGKLYGVQAFILRRRVHIGESRGMHAPARFQMFFAEVTVRSFAPAAHEIIVQHCTDQ